MSKDGMTLEEAIEILTKMGTPDFRGSVEQVLKARRLGIEALERQKQLRDLYVSTIKWAKTAAKLITEPLPSEEE